MTIASWIVGPQLIGMIFTIVGLVSYYFPPKKINDLYGYRSAASKQNQQTWDVANRYSSILSIKCGIVFLIGGIAIAILVNQTALVPAPIEPFLPPVLTVCSAIAMAVLLIVNTERHLKKTFKE